MNRPHYGLTLLLLFGALTLLPASAQTIAGGSCATADLSGPYALTFTGRAVSPAGTFTGTYESNGLATFDGAGKVTFAVTANSNTALGKSLSYTGTYSVASNCTGTISITTGGSFTLNLVEWSSGNQFNIAGSDATYNYTGSGSQNPGLCSTASLSGPYTYTASGAAVTGATINGTGDEAGLLQFDGAGNLTAIINSNVSGTVSSTTATGTYSVTPNCVGSGSLTDSTGKTTSLSFTLTNVNSSAFNLLAANSTYLRTGTAHSAFVNPDNAIGNVASYYVDSTPAGSVFVLFGQNLASRAVSASSVPLPTSLLNVSVTVNGELAPLFYADTGQIDAQIPWDIPGNTLANVVVKVGTTVSNTAAVFIPPTGTPGISVYGNNRAVVVNQSGDINSATAAANVGDTVVVYFTGGGPVNAAGKLVTGSPAPNGLSPITGSSSITVNGVKAKVNYIGLTPGSIGLYQANFVVPSVAKGTYPVVITISGVPSNNPVMTVAN